MTSKELGAIRSSLLKSKYDVLSDDTSYPYGRYRGDVKRKTVYIRKDGQQVPEEDLRIMQDFDSAKRKEGGGMAALSGIFSTKISADGMSLHVDYYRHTAG